MQAAKMRAWVSPCAPAMARPRSGAYVDAAVGDHLGTEAHHGQHDQVGPAGIDLLARAQRLVDDDGGRRRGGLGRRGRRAAASAAGAGVRSSAGSASGSSAWAGAATSGTAAGASAAAGSAAGLGARLAHIGASARPAPARRPSVQGCRRGRPSG
jgi:hypothetical protein